MTVLLTPEGWTRQGPVIVPTQTWETTGTYGGSFAEASVIQDGPVWKAWYLSFSDVMATGYATAPSPVGPWTHYSGNPVNLLMMNAEVIKVGATYHMFGALIAGAEYQDLYHCTSTDGVIWTNPITRTNLEANPSFEAGTAAGVLPTGWSDDKNTTGSSPYTAASALGSNGTKSFRISYTGGAGDSGAYIAPDRHTDVGGVSPGDVVTISMLVKATYSGTTLNRVRLSYCDAAGTSLQDVNLGIPSDGVTARRSASLGTAPAGTSRCRIVPQFGSIDTADTIDFYLDDILVEKSATPTAYFDGGTAYAYPLGYAWLGTANASVSVEGDMPLQHGGAGEFDHDWCADGFPFLDDSTWYMYYSGLLISGGGNQCIGVATASGISGPWTKCGGSPIVGAPTGLIYAARPCVQKIGDSYYYMWFHGRNGVALDDSCCFRAHARSPLGPWTVEDGPELARVTADEGPDPLLGQVSDVSVVDDGTQYVMLYTANIDASDFAANQGVIKAATKPYPTPTALFTVAEARAFDTALADDTKYPDATIEAVADEITASFERICGVSFIPAETTEVLDGTGNQAIWLRRHNPEVEQPPRPIVITAGSINGVALTAADLADIVCYPNGKVVRLKNGMWATSTRLDYGSVSLTYTHGWADVPAEIKRAALKMACALLVPSDISDRMTSYSDGQNSFQVTFAGPAPHWTGYNTVDAILGRYCEIPIGLA